MTRRPRLAYNKCRRLVVVCALRDFRNPPSLEAPLSFEYADIVLEI